MFILFYYDVSEFFIFLEDFFFGNRDGFLKVYEWVLERVKRRGLAL